MLCGLVRGSGPPGHPKQAARASRRAPSHFCPPGPGPGHGQPRRRRPDCLSRRFQPFCVFAAPGASVSGILPISRFATYNCKSRNLRRVLPARIRGLTHHAPMITIW
ncbi:hypothetical protein CT19431_MP100230 [Cupriavidus taiwanensis]|nr:hypothetical protein CT19431_MP100230 [Cupriavidus taiwanensis]